jgi:BirA family biotin operon repressor/biotin-[acetyl-CoA-carboxylase] ligase
MTSDDLSLELVQTALKTARFGRSLELKASTESTNDDARKASLAGAVDGHVIVADMQTRGRGARGRAWISPPGSDLYFSILADVPVRSEQLPPLTLAVGLAVSDALDAFLPENTRSQVKWPNDVWIDRKKCAGILIEASSQGERILPLVIGIGVNVKRTDFPGGLDTDPTSLALSGGRSSSRAELLAALLAHVERWVDRFIAEGTAPVVAALEQRLAMRGESASCDEVEGTVEGVAASGALRMRTRQGTVDVLAGTLRPLRT